MTTLEVGNRLVELMKVGDPKAAMDELYSPEIVSIESGGENPESKGIDACKSKADYFDSTFEVHGATILGPYPNGDKFALHLAYDITTKEGGQRFTMNEVALYQVKDDKIVWEKFYYDPSMM